VINLDKTIKELTTRLDVVHPYSASSYISNQSNRNNGINYWKGKTIISTKAWNDLYQKSSTYTDTYKNILTSRKPLQYFPDDYNSSIYSLKLIDELKEEAQEWNKEYYELLEYRKNPTLGRMRCSKCLLSGSNDDSIFVGIEKVFARIVRDQCNKNNAVNSHSDGIITYHCNIMNIFSCPFESKEDDSNSGDERGEESLYPFKREDLFVLHRISFAIEQAISAFFEITKQNEIIYEVDFVNDRVQEIHTKYNGEPESWGWQKNVKEQLSKIKPISNIVIRDKQDIYDILTDREKLEYLLQEYEKKNNYHFNKEQQVCSDEITLCVYIENNDSNNKNAISLTDTTELLVATEKNQQQLRIPVQELKRDDYSHKGENRHSKIIEKEELEKSHREQLTLLKNHKQNIIDFLLRNKDSIRIEDLKICEPIYKCYRQKRNCYICKSLTNIICTNCKDQKECWLCNCHWKQHRTDNH
jgi:hypothetical protein